MESAKIQSDSFTAVITGPEIGGLPVVELSVPENLSKDGSFIKSAKIIPGRGMNIYQLNAEIPGKGIFPMFASPSIDEASKFFDNGPEDYMGNRSFKIGGAILLPYPNRIRGKLLGDGKSLETKIMGKTVILPANWSAAGNTKGEKIAMHGLINKIPAENIRLESGKSFAKVTGTINAGDFDGRWIGMSKITVECILDSDGFTFSVVVENTGKESVPMAIGWHPYFSFPSEDRTQARLRMSADSYVPANDYDDVFPIGKILPVKGTHFDFNAPEGAALGNNFYDDSFTGLKYKDGYTVVDVIDPKADYGVRISANDINSAIQVYAPTDKNFVAVEPQFNLTDPFNEETWGKEANKGMAIIEPGKKTEYKVKIGLFRP